MTTTLLDCGHEPTPQAEGSCTNGIARTRDNKTMCFACAERNEKEAMRTERTYVVYVKDDRPQTEWERANHITSRKCHFTNWTGALLASGFREATTIFGRKGFSYRLVDIHGNRWHGRHAGYFAGAGCALTIRRCK